MNLTNYHSHCSFCDGRAPMEDFVKAAIAAGFTAYGVSSHAPLPFETKWTLAAGRVPEYLQELERLKAKYDTEIELYAGMEIDYLNEAQNPSISYFEDLPLDYRIGSVHLVYTEEGEIIDTDTTPENFSLLLNKHFHGDLQAMVRKYYASSMRLVESGGFDFIGHADKISFNADYCCAGVTGMEWYKKCRGDLFAVIAEKGIMMEVNTKAFFHKGRFFPGKESFNLIRELKIPVVVNSDAHFPELINAGRREALQALVEAGIRSVCELHSGVWNEVGIVL